MNRDEDIVSFDFQGWPNYKQNLREVLKGLGAIEKNGMIGFRSKDPILDQYPVTMEDDGMAYGVNPKFIVDADVNEEDNSIRMFIEPQTDIAKVDF